MYNGPKKTQEKQVHKAQWNYGWTHVLWKVYSLAVLEKGEFGKEMGRKGRQKEKIREVERGVN